MIESRRERHALAMIFAVHGAVPGTLATRLPWIQHHLQLSPAVLGAALVAPAIAACFTMPLASSAMRRFGSRNAVAGTAVILSLTLALPALATSVPLLWLGLVAYGGAAGITDVAMNANGVDVERRFGRSIMSGLHGQWSVGGLAGSALGAIMAYADVDARVH